MNKRIGVLGSGAVGTTLARGSRSMGYEAAIGSRNGKWIDTWDGPVGTFADVSSSADMLVLWVKGSAAEDVIKSVKASLSDKIIIDTTNPIAEGGPDDGVKAARAIEPLVVLWCIDGFLRNNWTHAFKLMRE